MIIGIAGRAGAGKDTVADYIITKLDNHVKMSFANPLKDMLRVGLDLTWDQLYGNKKEIIDPRYGCTPRYIMQTLGTEWGRELIHNDLWVLIATQSKDNRRVYADVRFENEAKFIRETGHLIYVNRGAVIDMNHASEAGIIVKASDYWINNHRSLDSLYKQIDNIISNINLKINEGYDVHHQQEKDEETGN